MRVLLVLSWRRHQYIFCQINLSLVLNCFCCFQGTLPFMPLDALNIDNRGKYVHSPAHDLEALLQTVLGLAMFTTGPYQARTQTTLHVPTVNFFLMHNINMHNCNNASDLVGNQLGRRGLCIIFYCCIMHSPAKAFMHYGGEIFANFCLILPKFCP